MPDGLPVAFRDEVMKDAFYRRIAGFRYDNAGDVMRNFRRDVLAAAGLVTLWALPQGTALIFNFVEEQLIALRTSWSGTPIEADETPLQELAQSKYLIYSPGRCYAALSGRDHHPHDRVTSACLAQVQ